MTERIDFKWKRIQGTTAPDLYANMVHLLWTLDDVTARVGQLVVSDDPNEPYVVKEMGSITFSWRSAKLLRDNLIALIDSQEKANGEIKTDLTIAPTP